jgi:PAS domain-containing protein
MRRSQTWRDAQRARLFEFTQDQAGLLSMDRQGAVWLRDANGALQSRLGLEHLPAPWGLEQVMPMDEAVTLRHHLRHGRGQGVRYQRTVPTGEGLRQLEGWLLGLGHHEGSRWWLWRVRDKTELVEARGQLRLLRRRLQGALEAMPWPACLVDQRLVVVQRNAAWRRRGQLAWLGQDPGDALLLAEGPPEASALRGHLRQALRDALRGRLQEWGAPLPRTGALRLRALEPADAGVMVYLEPPRRVAARLPGAAPSWAGPG